ncbi:MAG TPA: EAL domain-containing protein [Pseudonocardia sp.]
MSELVSSSFDTAAPRTRPTSVRAAGGRAAAAAVRAGSIDAAALRMLAQRWAIAVTPPLNRALVVRRLAAVLRELALVLRAEPFEAAPARAIGADLFAAGLFTDPSDGAARGAVLASSLRLLRADTTLGAMGIRGPEGERRMRTALDELAGGFAAGTPVMGAPAAAPPTIAPPAIGLPAAGSSPAGPSVVTLPVQASADPRVTVYDQVPLGIAVLSLDGHVLAANPDLTTFLLLGDTLTAPRPFTDFVYADDLPEVVERYGRLIQADPDTQRMDARLVRPDGVIVWVRILASLARDPLGRPSHVIVVIEDEPERLWSPSAEGTVAEQLARLPGASLTEDWLQRAFAGAFARVGICALDLDRFGALVDAYGAAVGDRLLLAVAGRLRYAAGEHLATRTGNDEFTVLIADPEDVAAVCRVADRLQSALAVPFSIDGHELVISASVGVAEGTVAHGCPREIQRAADVACSWATALGGGHRVVFDPRRDAGEAARYALVSGMPGAITNGEFRLAYQPLVTLPDGMVRGAEALVRWQHPQEGLIGPGRFIGLAEQSGAIVALGRWVLRTACEQAAAWWRELGEQAPFVSVNVSPVQLAEASWVDEVIDALRTTGLPPRQLQLEITEQAVLGDGTAVTEGLSALRAAGVRLALDDFGTGWSSLAWLRRLPVHALKIDGSFVDGLRHPDADTADAAIIGALVGMAHALGIEVTAEWVETGVQSERLAALSCDLGQGRWFGDAGPGEWVPGLVRRRMGVDPLAL